MQRINWNYESVKKFIEVDSESDCKLISQEYLTNKTDLEVQCKCGEVFTTKFNKFKDRNKRQCNKCSIKNRTAKIIKQIKFNCDYCGKENSQIPSQYNKCKYHFCDNRCASMWRSENLTGENNPLYKKESHVKYNCDCCGKESECPKFHYNRYKNHFCSKKCKAEWQSIHKSGENSPIWKYGEITYQCDMCEKNNTTSVADYNKHKNHFCSKECKAEWQSIHIRRENHPRWDPSITQEEREDSRRYVEYDDWRKKVYERDNYTCQCCGEIGNGSNLNAHHLNGYKWDVENRTNVNNGITLCETCHKEFHGVYGKGKNTKEQFEEFLINKFNKSA